MGLESYTDRELLELYAPVLRFSGGENFLPMNVEDYVAGETHLVRTVKGKKKFDEAWESANPKERLKIMGGITEGDAYLQYITRSFRFDHLPRIILTVEVVALVLALIFGMVGLSKIYPSMGLDYADVAKMLILGFFIAVWPFIDADGKVHLALMLNLFGIFFFGTVFTIVPKK
jgi:hypothetical protein